MTQLGNVFEGFDEGRVRGPDLRVSVEVPRAALGGSLRVAVPLRLAHEGDLVERAIEPSDPEHLVLHLPASLPAGAVLRLRGQGGVRDQAAPGDLFVAIELVDRAPRPDEQVVSPPSTLTAAPSTTLTWLILLGFALAAAATLTLAFV